MARSKLATNQRDELVRRYLDGEGTQAELAAEYGVSHPNVSQLVQKRVERIASAERQAAATERLARAAERQAAALEGIEAAMLALAACGYQSLTADQMPSAGAYGRSWAEMALDMARFAVGDRFRRVNETEHQP